MEEESALIDKLALLLASHRAVIGRGVHRRVIVPVRGGTLSVGDHSDGGRGECKWDLVTVHDARVVFVVKYEKDAKKESRR